MNTAPWPYPRWIAHRGGGSAAPENTLAAFRLAARLGWRMAECDVKLSADGVAFLLHDDTLDRTTDGRGPAGERHWAQLARLDAGAWHSSEFAGEPLPSLQDVASWSQGDGQGHMLNIEIKPSPGEDRRTGEAVAAEAARLWRDVPVAPLLTSFSAQALEGARASAPGLPRGMLLEEPWDDWEETARALGCVALVAHHALWNTGLVALARTRGWRCLAYTVNGPRQARRLLALGLDGLITDSVARFDPNS
jgi:glycerophosphoryl diester phosphodiesterase